MTNTSKTAVIIIVGLVLAVAIEFFILIKPQSLQKNHSVNLDADTIFFQSDRIARINLNVSSCTVKIFSWEENRFEVSVRSNREQQDKPYALLQDDSIIIQEDEQELSNSDKTEIIINVPLRINLKEIFAKTTSGKIEYSSKTFPALLQLEAEFGNIVVTLQKDFDYNLSYETKTGKVEYPSTLDTNTTNSLNDKAGEKCSIILKTESGNISILSSDSALDENKNSDASTMSI